MEAHRPTENCLGCRHALIGESQRPHTTECRNRFEEILGQVGDPRVLSEIERLMSQQELAEQLVQPPIIPKYQPGDDAMYDGEDNRNDNVMDAGSLFRLTNNEDQYCRLMDYNDIAGKPRENWESDIARMNKALQGEGIEGAIMDLSESTL